MAVQVVPFALQNAAHSAAVFRQAMSGPYVSGGILSAAELAVSQQGTPNMSVILGAGRAKVTGNSVSPPSGLAFTTQAMYDVLNDANLSLTIATSNPTNPRIDAVYLQVQDSFYSGASNQAIAAVATGTAAASPVAPSIPANSMLVAYVAVAANTTTIVSANITMQTTLAKPLPNTTFPTFGSQAALTQAFPSPSQGDVAFRSDLGYRVRYFAQYNVSTNPSGANTPGWYRDPGDLPWVQEYVLSSDQTTTSTSTVAGMMANIFQVGLGRFQVDWVASRTRAAAGAGGITFDVDIVSGTAGVINHSMGDTVANNEGGERTYTAIYNHTDSAHTTIQVRVDCLWTETGTKTLKAGSRMRVTYLGPVQA